MSKFGVSCWKWFFIMAIILVMSGVVINNSDNQKTQDSKIMGKAFIEDLNSLGTKGDSNKLEVESNQQIIETGQEPLEEETLDEIEDFQTEFQEIEMKQEPLEEETLDEIEDFQTELQERQCVPQFLSKTKCQGNAVMKEYQESNCNIIWALWGECDSLCKEGKCVETICIPGNMECNGKYVQKCIKVGSDWEINYEYCSTGCEDGKCKPTCTSGYLGEKRCSGNSIEVKYQSPDCSYKWIYQYDCSEKCVEGMCVYKSQTRDDSEPTCEQKYFDEYQCSGDRYERGLQDSNCSIVWVLWESCKYGCGTDGKCNPQPMETSDVRVSSVIAGDTIKLDNGEIVRLIGINAPEKGEKCYEESIGHFTSLVEGKEVTLERDVENRGQYGRLLRYVFVRGIHVNVNMVEQGKAIAYVVKPNTKYETELIAAERNAKGNEMCVWGLKEMHCNGCVKVAYIHYDAESNDCYNLNDEYVTFQNNCPYDCDVTGWTVKDITSRPAFVFPNREFRSGEQLTLYTGCGSNTRNKFYWCSTGYTCNAVWNNEGDTLFLRDKAGGLILSYTY